MKRLQMRIFFIALFLCLCTTAFAQSNIGEKVSEFQLQATDGRSYGVSHSTNTVSVLFFVGYN